MLKLVTTTTAPATIEIAGLTFQQSKDYKGDENLDHLGARDADGFAVKRHIFRLDGERKFHFLVQYAFFRGNGSQDDSHPLVHTFMTVRSRALFSTPVTAAWAAAAYSFRREEVAGRVWTVASTGEAQTRDSYSKLDDEFGECDYTDVLSIGPGPGGWRWECFVQALCVSTADRDYEYNTRGTEPTPEWAMEAAIVELGRHRELLGRHPDWPHFPSFKMVRAHLCELEAMKEHHPTGYAF